MTDTRNTGGVATAATGAGMDIFTFRKNFCDRLNSTIIELRAIPEARGLTTELESLKTEFLNYDLSALGTATGNTGTSGGIGQT